MKKIISLLLCITFFSAIFGFCGNAQEICKIEAEPDYGKNCINVKLSSSVKYNTNAAFYLLMENETYSEAENALRMADGKYIPGKTTECEIKLGDDINDRFYRVYGILGGTKSDETAVYSDKFKYVGSKGQKNILSLINSAGEWEIADIAFENLSVILKFSEQSSPAWKNEYLFNAKRYDYNGEFKNISEVGKSWVLADILKSVNSAGNETLEGILNDNAEILGIDLSDSDYIRGKKEICRLLSESAANNNVKCLKAFSYKFNEFVAVASVNAADASELDALFKKYSAKLGIESLMQEYSKLDSLKVARQFDGFKAENAEVVKAKFRAVLDLFASSDNGKYTPPAGGGGGGSGGGGGGKNVSIAPGAVKEEKNNSGVEFNDISNDFWAYEPIMALSKAGIIKGYEDGSFRSEKEITREEFAKIITEAFGITAVSGDETEFSDVSASFWAYESIKSAANAGIIEGKGDGSFGLGEKITREDAAVMLCRTAKYLEKAFLPAEFDISEHFSDGGDIADYASEAVGSLAAANIINGYENGGFVPKDSVTRAQAAKMIYMMLKEMR